MDCARKRAFQRIDQRGAEPDSDGRVRLEEVEGVKGAGNHVQFDRDPALLSRCA